MKKTILSVACITLMILGLFLVSCQKKETATKETAKETAGYGEEKPAAEAGGYGEEKPAAEAGGYGAEKPAAPAAEGH